jgi:type I restriction enzyme S subunit
VSDAQLIIPKYLYYVLSSDDFFEYDMRHSKGAKMPRGDKRAVMEYRFNVPSLQKQEDIVRILDSFDVLYNDLSSGLPAEIEALQKQYEYYRDKLLDFKEMK